MSMHVVLTAEDAYRVTEHFNAFHDGFIRRFVLTSADFFESHDVLVTTGRLDIEISFAHSNYLEGTVPFDRVIHARFSRVRDLQMSITGLEPDWPISAFEMTAPPSAPDAPTGRITARLTQPRLIANSRWDTAEAMSFTFERAEFLEPEE